VSNEREITAERLEALLRELDQSDTGLNDPVTDRDELRRELRDLVSVLARRSEAGEDHFELDDLVEQVKTRRRDGESWLMPEHLARCPLCLETLELLLEGVPQPPPSILDRFVRIRDDRPPAHGDGKVIVLPPRWLPMIQVAAVFLVLWGAALVLSSVWRAGAVRVRAGQVTLADGKVLQSGAGVPEGVVVHAAAATETRLRDGSELRLDEGTHLSFHKSRRGDTTIRLIDGALLASVVPQEPDREFRVVTRLGEVLVVGTRFRVECSSLEDGSGVVGRADGVKLVRVLVYEGVVRVRGGDQHATVGARQTAVLREGSERVEVVSETPIP